MKNIYLITIMVCSAFWHQADAQDWQPFSFDRSQLWSQFEDDKTTVESIVVAKVDELGSNVGFFNSVPCAAWDFEALADFYRYRSDIVNYDRPAWVLIFDDNIVINAYDRQVDEWFAFEFRTRASLGESWETEGLTVSCDSVYVTEVMGVQDSAKLYRCNSAMFGTQEFILSKTYGFIKYPPLRNFYDQEISAARPYFKLEGGRDNGIQYGTAQPQFEDDFHLQEGDILVWRSVIAKSSIDTTYQIDTIQEVTVIGGNQVTYATRRGLYNSAWQLQWHGDQVLSYEFAREGRILEGPTSWITPPDGSSFLHTTDDMELRVENDDTVIIAHTYNTSMDIDPQTCSMGIWFDLWSEATYSTKAGLIRQLTGGLAGTYVMELIGSVIDGERDGITEIPSFVSIPHALPLKVFPNPTSDVFHIVKDEDIRLSRIHIYDGQGRLVHTASGDQNKVDLGQLPSGVFLVRAIDEHGSHYIARISKM